MGSKDNVGIHVNGSSRIPTNTTRTEKGGSEKTCIFLVLEFHIAIREHTTTEDKGTLLYLLI